MSSIDRIRYYDSEFLRAFDFSDEQTYHMEMRRRVNRYLHLYGIAYGLTLSSDAEGGITQVSIQPGMAIDGFGREIYVFQPYTLGDADITANRIPATGGTYDVWLRYQKTPSTPPSAGYGNCNQANQYTRWVESFSIVLLPSPSNPSTDPAFTDQDTDDPSQDQTGVLLGTVSVLPTSVTAVFSSPNVDPNRCKLLGVIAQRIQVPPSWDVTQATLPPFSFLNQPAGALNISLSSPASLEIVPNIFADQNLIVGLDFPLTSSTSGQSLINQPPPTGPPGSVKIAGDLFVQGNIYSPTSTAGGTQWNGISTYVSQLVQSLMPAFVASQPTQITVTTSAPSATSFSSTAPAIIIPTSLTSVNSVVAFSATISGIQLAANVSFTSSVGVFITNVTAAPGPGANQCSFTLTYTVTGDFAAGGQPSILSFYVTLAAVCFPPSS